MPLWDPQNTFPGIPGSAFCLALLHSLKRNPGCLGIFDISLERVFGIPKHLSCGKMKLICWAVVMHLHLDGRNRAIVIAESLARVIAAIRFASVRWRSYHPPNAQRLVLRDPVFVVLRFELRDWRSFPRGTSEWPARVDSVH